MSHWAEKYLAIPYREHGTDWKGADCWGLYCIICAMEAHLSFGNISILDRTSLSAIRHAISAQMLSGQWIEQSSPCTFSAVVMSAPGTGSGAPLHIGCAISAEKFIQTTRLHGPHILDFKDKRAGRFLGFYLPAELVKNDRG